MYSTTRIPVSLEFFPPKTAEGADKLRLVRQQLFALRPSYCSVTYGAGGSTQSGTFDCVQEILQEGMQAASHFTCVHATRQSVRNQLQTLKAMGVHRLVALRGDLPLGYQSNVKTNEQSLSEGEVQDASLGDFRYASDLVEFIRAETGAHFRIAVAAYPETHPQAAHPHADMQAFVAKVHAGADVGITQYFYNADAYFRLRDELRALGVNTPIVPGILPITNAAQLIRFSDACGTEIPQWIRRRLLAYANDHDSIQAFGLDVVSEMCQRLRVGGAPSFHFYTLNQAGPTQALCERLGLDEPMALAA